jgi:hypothetical protein
MEEIKELATTNGNNDAIYKIATDAIESDNKERNKIRFDRINNDVNGNPRYVVHFLQCRPNDQYSYGDTCKLMNKIGGREYHNKSYGGGIVFQSYSLTELENSINELKHVINNEKEINYNLFKGIQSVIKINDVITGNDGIKYRITAKTQGKLFAVTVSC